MYRNILVSVDLNDAQSWQLAFPVARELCKRFDAKLHVVTVVPDFGVGVVAEYFPADYEQAMLDETDKQLRQLVAGQFPADAVPQCIVAQGTIYHEIIQAAGRSRADLIVIASHRPELKDYLIGPNASKVVRHSGQSVLVVRA
jgi:nucleotide-binding universal stress UspA family protein